MRASDPVIDLPTARILVRRALKQSCGQECVDWATAMLERGASGSALAMLAGMIPPFNHFELAQLRDQALREIAIVDVDDSTGTRLYAAACLRVAVDGRADLVETVRLLGDLCVALKYPHDLYDFYLLRHADDDLKLLTFSPHLPDATRENILSIMRERAQAFLAAADSRS